MSIRQIVESYLSTIAAGETGDRLAAFFHPQVVQEEFPNRLVANGAKRDLAAILDGAARGQKVMASQTFDLLNCVAYGDTAAAETLWTGTLAVPIGTLKPGDIMRARFAMFFEFRDGLIWRQRNYDCFDPF